MTMRKLFLLLAVSMVLTACGKKGALIYPDMLVPASPASFSALQSGDMVKISFAVPDKDRAGRKVMDIAGVKVFKLESPSGQAPVCRDCPGYILFKTFYPEIPGNIQRYGSLAVMLDGNVEKGREYSYKAAAFTKEGIDGEVTAPLHVAMVQPLQPPVLRIISSPTELRLEFTGETGAAGKLLGYNLYRKQRSDVWPYLPLNAKPVTDTYFADTGLDRRERYLYVVKSVHRLSTGQIIESLPSHEVEAGLKDEE